MNAQTLWRDTGGRAVESGTTDARKELFTPQDTDCIAGSDGLFAVAVGEREVDFVAGRLKLWEIGHGMSPTEEDGFILIS